MRPKGFKHTEVTKNEDISDNRLENLQLLKGHKEHTTIHNKGGSNA